MRILLKTFELMSAGRTQCTILIATMMCYESMTCFKSLYFLYW